MCGYVHTSVGAYVQRTEGWVSLELELETAVSCLIQMLGTELKFFSRKYPYNY